MTIRNTQWTLFLFILITLGASGVVFGQEQMTGTWKAEFKEKHPDTIEISFYSDDSGDAYQHGSSFKLDRLQGLSPGQVKAASAPVNFTIISEAGNIDLTGTFQNAKGKGTFIFTPDRGFSSAVEALGFKKLAGKKLMASAVLDVKLSTVSDLRNSGITVNDYEDVFKATIFKIDSVYITDMSNAGFDNLDMEGLVKGRIFKIDADYAGQIIAMGFGKRSFEELVKFRIFKVTPEFLNEMRAEGYSELNADQVVQLRIFKIDTDFIRDARSKGYSNPTVEELVQLRIRGKID